MLHASKIIALSAYELLVDGKEVLEQAKAEFLQSTKGKAYKVITKIISLNIIKSQVDALIAQGEIETEPAKRLDTNSSKQYYMRNFLLSPSILRNVYKRFLRTSSQVNPPMSVNLIT
ncbi:hypothetical protein PGLA_24040 [Paenibacillus glacialis]|uniref:Uncharacterized protein n=1 Tax=Paenibacillus glacialis TaxID=494026 RepID=A0A168D8S3_9BACL|nr:hypothetical protein PGLA_24040 [Paenibacillus glacialis]